MAATLAKSRSDQAVAAPGRRRRRESRYAAGFLLPALVFVAAFVAYPLGYSGFLSFFSWDGTSARRFVGLDNFHRILTDGYFWHALGNNALVAVTAMVFQVFIALVLAYWIVRVLGRIGRVYLFFYLVPVILSEICIGLLWSFVYNPYFGLLNSALKPVGLASFAHGWLGDSATAFPAVIMVMNFTYLGLYVLLFVAAVQNLPEEVYDAARIDGAGHIRTFFSVTVPMVSETTRSTALLCIISSFKTFSLVWVLTNGGPDHASEVVSTYLYKVGFNSFEMGYAATIGFFQMLLTAVAGLLVFRILRRSGAQSG